MARLEGSGQITGLRDRKRQRSRVLTVEVAWRLFIERGYDNVTVADICAAAEIAPRTFHRYFAGKEDVVAEPVRRMADLVAEHLSDAPADLSDAAALQKAIHELGVFVLDHGQWLGALRTVIQQSNHLRAAHQGVPPEREQDLSSRLAARQPGGGEPTWQQRLLVACSVAAFRIWYDDYLRGGLDEPLERLDAMMATVSRPALGG
jgi:AcrR family transcriptional regulator